MFIDMCLQLLWFKTSITLFLVFLLFSFAHLFYDFALLIKITMLTEMASMCVFPFNMPLCWDINVISFLFYKWVIIFRFFFCFLCLLLSNVFQLITKLKSLENGVVQTSNWRRYAYYNLFTMQIPTLFLSLEDGFWILMIY